MEHQKVSSGSPFEAEIGFSRAVRAGQHVFVSGTAPIWPDGSCDPDPTAQARRCLEIIGAALEQLDASYADVVRTRMFVTSTDVTDSVGRAHGEVLGSIRPVTTMVVVQGLIDP